MQIHGLENRLDLIQEKSQIKEFKPVSESVSKISIWNEMKQGSSGGGGV